MKSSILSAEDFTTAHWSGGTTTELFIFPERASFKNLEFDYRLSLATIETDTSVFTPLEGVKRTLMLLDGELTLVHTNRHTTSLTPYQSDQFEGGWQTKSIGKCAPFNLMITGETKGELSHRTVKKSASLQIDFDVKVNPLIVYVHKGQINLEIKNEKHSVREHQLFVTQDVDIDCLAIHGVEPSEVVICKITD